MDNQQNFTNQQTTTPVVQPQVVNNPQPVVQPQQPQKPQPQPQKKKLDTNDVKKLLQQDPKMKKIIKKGKRHYWWRYLLVFFTGFIFCIAAIVGTAVFAATAITSQQLLTLVGLNPNDVLTEKYQGKTIYEIVADVVTGEVSFNNLKDISELTPAVENLIATINVELDKAIGFEFNVDELMTQSWDEIGPYVMSSIQNGIELPTVLGITEDSDKILKYLGYDKEGNPRSLGDLMNDFDSIIGEATLEDLIDVGTEGILYNLRDVHINNMAEEMNNRKLNQIITIDETSVKALQYLGNFGINDLSSAIDNATIGDLIEVGTEGILFNISDVHLSSAANELNTRPLNQIIDIAEDAFPALKYLGNYSVNEMNDALENATLGDLIPIEEGSILYKLKDSKLDDLPNEVTHLKVKDVIEITEDSSPVLKFLKDYQLDQLDQAMNDMTLGDVIVIDASSPKILHSLSTVKVSELSTSLESLTLAEMIDIGDNRILQALSGATLDTLDETVNNLTLGDVIDTSTGPKILQSLADTKINDLATKIDSLTLGEMIDVGENRILKALENATLSSLSMEVENLTIGDIVDTEASDTPNILIALKDTRINDLSGAINNLTVNDIITITEDSPLLLKALADTKINDLETKIHTLTIGDLFTAEELDDCIFLGAMGGDTKIEDMATRINELTFVEVFKDSIFENPDDPSTIKPMWVYVLKDETGTIRLDYKVAFDMDNLIANMERNIENSTLRQMYQDGLIDISDASVFEKRIPGDTKKIGDYTMSGLLEKITELAV